jgi:APA family basic amino acid/polyamine antiporter
MTTDKNKALGLFALTALVAGNMIGSGVFLLPANLAHIGSISLYAWLFTAVGAMLLAVMFARLSIEIPKTGGPYSYTREALGRFLGFQTAYHYWIMVWTGNAAIALAAVGYLRVFLPSLADPVYASCAAIALVWILTLVNALSLKTVGVLQIVTFILKLIPLLIVGIAGWWYIQPQYFTEYYNVTEPVQSDFLAVSSAATLVLWAFVGLESATLPAGSAHNPQRNIPLATILGTLIAALVYILGFAAIIGMIPAPLLQQSVSPYADAAYLILGTWGRDLVAIGAVIACIGTLNGWILLQGQVAMAAAEDGLFPRLFGKRSQQGIPMIGLFFSSGLITVLLLLTISPDLVEQFKLIILMATLAALIPYFYTATADGVLLWRKQQRWQLKHYVRLLITLLAGIYAFWAIIGAGQEVLYYGALLLISSVPLYALCDGRVKE